MMKRLLSLLITVVGIAGMRMPVCAWTTEYNLTPDMDTAYGRCVVRFGPSGRMHFVFQGIAPGSYSRIYYQYNDGANFSARQALPDGGYKTVDCDMALDSNENIHVVAMYRLDGTTNTPYTVFYWKYNGSTWTGPRQISDGLGDDSHSCGRPGIAVDKNDDVHIVWRQGKEVGGKGDIMYCRTVGGVWQAVRNLTANSSPNPYGSDNPDIAADANGSGIHVVWHDEFTGFPRVYYTRSSDYGANWLPSTQWVQISSDDYGKTPTIVLDRNDYPNIWWTDSNAKYQGYRRWNGSSWTPIANWGLSVPVMDAVFDDSNVMHYVYKNGSPWECYYRTYNYSSFSTPQLISGGNATYKNDFDAIAIDGSGYPHVIWNERKSITPELQISYLFYSNNATSVAPGPVSAFTVTGAANGTINLRWTNPNSAGFYATRILCKTTGYPTNPGDGTLVCDKAGTPGAVDTFSHTGLVNGTTYYYTAFARDNSTPVPLYSSGVTTSGVPVAPPKVNLLSGGSMDAFTGGVANGWTSFRVNDPNNAISFTSDTSRSTTGGVSQAITGIDSTNLPATGLTAAGMYQVVSGLTVGKVYQLVGNIDLINSNNSGVDQRYLLNFGINTSGGNAPGTPTTDGTIGGCRWMQPEQALWNHIYGSYIYFGGTFHRAAAAFPATSTSVSVWTGITINNPAVRDSVPTRFNADNFALYEWDVPTYLSLQNGNFEGNRIDMQNGGDIIPEGWTPCGGGVGERNCWNVLSKSPYMHSGLWSFEAGNRRGSSNFGIMQRIRCNPGYNQTFSAWARSSGIDNATASIGIDPYGGLDIHSPNIVWKSTTSNVFTQLTVSAVSQSNAITVFLRTSNLGSAPTDAHNSYFDDCTYSYAGPPVYGSISGYVRDNAGYPIAGAQVYTSTGGYSTTSAADGSYTLVDVIPGSYTISAAKTDYQTQNLGPVTVSSDHTSTVNFSLTPVVRTIPQAKGTADATPLCLSEGVVSAVFPGMFYIEQTGRQHGIRVDWSGSVDPGDSVTVSGVMATVSGERCITARRVDPASTGDDIPLPIGMTNQCLGGGPFGLQQAVKDAFGPSNIGLLVRTWGKVTDAGAGYIVIDDGSIGGVKVYTSYDPGTAKPYVIVTGISACEIPAGESVPVRVIRATEVRSTQ